MSQNVKCMNDFVLTHAVAWHRTFINEYKTRDRTKQKSAVCHLETGKWQLKRLRDIK